MNSKKGFTLVELLAVISILAILVVLALPNVIEMFQDAQVGAFKTEVQQLMKQAENQWVLDNGGTQRYASCGGEAAGSITNLKMKNDVLYYDIEVNPSGEFDKIIVANKSFAFDSTQTGSVTKSVEIDEEVHIYKKGSEDTGSKYNTATTTNLLGTGKACAGKTISE